MRCSSGKHWVYKTRQEYKLYNPLDRTVRVEQTIQEREAMRKDENGKKSPKSYSDEKNVSLLNSKLENRVILKIRIDENLRFVEEPQALNRGTRCEEAKRRRIPLCAKFVGTLRQEQSIPGNENDQFRINIPLFSEPVPSSNVAT
ncbi:hypothetical protein Tco_1243438 [Tanacetum coccineum]